MLSEYSFENQPLVSIITPSYNQACFIEDNIISVVSQDYPNIEHIIVDGNSKDNTIEMIKKHENSYNLKWVSEPDKGQSDAINKGFKMSNGEIIGWINSDDYYEKDAVSTAVEYMLRYPDIKMIYGDCNLVDTTGSLIKKYPTQDFDYNVLLNENSGMIPQQSVFIRRQVIEKVGLIDISYHYAMDYEYWLRIGRDFKIAYIPKMLASFRIQDDSKTSSKYNSFKFYYDVIRANIKHKGRFMSPLHLKFAKWLMTIPFKLIARGFK